MVLWQRRGGSRNLIGGKVLLGSPRNEEQPWPPRKPCPAKSQARQPGRETDMKPRPSYRPRYKGSGRLAGKVAIITGGDSGIGRAVAVLFAREGADVAIIYLEECEDARETVEAVRREGQRCLTLAGDIAQEEFCRGAVQQALDQFGRIDVLVNNAAEQHEQQSISDISSEQLTRTFATNVFGYFYMTKAALPPSPAGLDHRQHGP